MDEESLWDVLAVASQESHVSSDGLVHESRIEYRLAEITALGRDEMLSCLQRLEEFGYVWNDPGAPVWRVTQAGFAENERRAADG